MACSAEPEQPKTELCQLCSTDTEAAFMCEQCNFKLCQSCRATHLQSEAGKDHRILNIVTELKPDDEGDNNGDDGNDDEAESKRLENSKLCSIHPDKYIKMYCMECETFVCNTCICELHEGHSFERLIVVVDRSREQLTEIIKATKQRIAELQKQLESLEEYREDYTALTDMAIEDIRREKRRLKEKIDKVADDLIEEQKAKLRRYIAYCQQFGRGLH